jgi:hypothetical protein
MTEERATELVATIQAQFPHVFTHALPSYDTRNKPFHWFVEVKRAPIADQALILHSELDYQDALRALHVLNA